MQARLIPDGVMREVLGLREKERIQDGGLEKSPDVARAEVIGNIGKLAQTMEFLGGDGGVMIHACPAVESLPIFFEDVLPDRLIELGAGIGRRHRELYGECVEFFGVSNRFLDSLDRVVREAQGIVSDDPYAQFVTALDNAFLLGAGNGFALVVPQNLLIGRFHADLDAPQSCPVQQLKQFRVEPVGARLHAPADVEVVPEQKIGKFMGSFLVERQVRVSEGNSPDIVFCRQIADFVDNAFCAADPVAGVYEVRAIVAGIGAAPASQHGKCDPLSW